MTKVNDYYLGLRGCFALAQGSGPQISLLNIIIELKKCCNHPFLFATAEEDYRGNEGDQNAVDRLVLTSGKMVLLDKLMRSLKQNGHRYRSTLYTSLVVHCCECSTSFS